MHKQIQLHTTSRSRRLPGILNGVERWRYLYFKIFDTRAEDESTSSGVTDSRRNHKLKLFPSLLQWFEGFTKYPVFIMAMPLNMILFACHTMYIVIWFEQTNILVYTCTYISLITMTNKSVMTFISVNKIYVCLSVCLWNMEYKFGHLKLCFATDFHKFKWPKIIWVCKMSDVSWRHIFNPLSAGTVFRRQNMTSVDVRFWRLKTVPHCKNVNIANGNRPLKYVFKWSGKS